MAEQPVRLVLLGDASAAPVCDGDVCYLPGSAVTVDSVDASAHRDHDADTEAVDPPTPLG